MRFNFNEYSDVLRAHFDEATYMDFSQLCRDVANNELQGSITLRQGSDKIREKMLEIYQLPMNPTDREIRRSMKYQDRNVAAFEIIEDVLEDTLVSGWNGSEFWRALVDTKNNRLGQKNMFFFPDNTVISVARINNGHSDMIRQRLGEGTERSVEVSSIGAKIYMSWSRFLQGVEDWFAMIEKISTAFSRYIDTMIHGAFVTAGKNLPEPKWYTGGKLEAANHDKFVQLISDVMLATGSEVMIVGTKPALAQLKNLGDIAWIAEEAKKDVYNTGRIGTFEGTQIVELPQAFELNNVNAYLEEDKNIYIFPVGFDKPIKFYWEGDTEIIAVTDNTTHIDKSIDYQVQATCGCEVMTGKRFGTWVIAE